MVTTILLLLNIVYRDAEVQISDLPDVINTGFPLNLEIREIREKSGNLKMVREIREKSGNF